MNYVLIKQPWIDMIRRQHWFNQECVPYPQNKYTPPFLRKAYFVPEYRLQGDKRFATIFIGAYESHAHARLTN
jgi:hypothetical protein